MLRGRPAFHPCLTRARRGVALLLLRIARSRVVVAIVFHLPLAILPRTGGCVDVDVLTVVDRVQEPLVADRRGGVRRELEGEEARMRDWVGRVRVGSVPRVQRELDVAPFGRRRGQPCAPPDEAQEKGTVLWGELAERLPEVAHVALRGRHADPVFGFLPEEFEVNLARAAAEELELLPCEEREHALRHHVREAL